MKSQFLRIVFAIVLIATVATPAFAAGKKKKGPEYHDTVVTSVTATSITITQDKTPRTYPINQFTEITFKGQRVALATLQPGMAVSVTLGTDGVTASRINADSPPAHFEDTRKPAKVPSGFR